MHGFLCFTEIQSRPLPPTPNETPQLPIQEENQSLPSGAYDNEEIYERLPPNQDSTGNEGLAQPIAEPCSVKYEIRQEEIIESKEATIDQPARKQPKAKPPPPPVPPKPQNHSLRQSQENIFEYDTYVQFRKLKQSECEHSATSSSECRKKKDSLIEPDPCSLASRAATNNKKSSYTACTLPTTPDPSYSDV